MGGKEVRKMSCGAQPEQNSLPETPSGIPPTAYFFSETGGCVCFQSARTAFRNHTMTTK